MIDIRQESKELLLLSSRKNKKHKTNKIANDLSFLIRKIFALNNLK